MALFQYGGKRGISCPFGDTSKESPVFCGKKPGTRPQPQRPTLLNHRFYSDHIRAAFSSPSDTQQNKQDSCPRAQPDDFFFVSSTSINSSYSAVPTLPELLTALCQHSNLCSCVMERIKELVHLGVFLGVFSQMESPSILADTMQEEHKSV